MSKPCWPKQIDRNALDKAMTPDRVRMIYERFRTELDAGNSFEASLGKVGKDLGMPHEVVAFAITKPKMLRPFVEAVYRRQSIRRDAVRNAKLLVKTLDTRGFEQLASRAFHFRRTILTSGHFGVFPVTHAGDLALRFSSAPLFWKTAYRSWMKSGRVAHEMAMSELRASDRFDWWKSQGAKIAMEDEPVGILSRGMSGRSRRAFDFLKVAQYELMERALKKAERQGYDKGEVGKQIADWGNKATGRTGGKVPFSRLQFAPQLTAAKWSRAIIDPIRTIKTAYEVATGKHVAAGDRFIAAHRTRMAAEMAITYATFLGLNQFANTILGSKDKINFTDFKHPSDLLAFKIHGHTFGVGTGVLEVYRLLGGLVAVGRMTKQELHGRSHTEEIAKRLGRYAMFKMEPTIGGIAEALSKEDALTGRPLPWSSDKGAKDKPRMGKAEYAFTHFAPIPISGVMREAYDTMRKEGADPSDITKLLKTAAHLFVTGSGAEAGGFRYHPSHEQKKKH